MATIHSPLLDAPEKTTLTLGHLSENSTNREKPQIMQNSPTLKKTTDQAQKLHHSNQTVPEANKENAA